MQATPHTITDGNYLQWLQDLKARYRQSQIKAATAVNSQLLHFYWLLGADIYSRSAQNYYGSKFFDTLSRDLNAMLSEAEGLSESNLKFALRFYKMYALGTNVNREQPVPELIDEPEQQQIATEVKIE